MTLDEELDAQVEAYDAEQGLAEAYGVWASTADDRAWTASADERHDLEIFYGQEDEAIMDHLPLLLNFSYAKYLQSDLWKLRAGWVKRSGICERCWKKTPQLDAHHRTYVRLGRERLTDIMALCRACHGTIHQALKS